MAELRSVGRASDRRPGLPASCQNIFQWVLEWHKMFWVLLFLSFFFASWARSCVMDDKSWNRIYLLHSEGCCRNRKGLASWCTVCTLISVLPPHRGKLVGRVTTTALMLNFVVQDFTSLTYVHHICASHLYIEAPLLLPSPSHSVVIHMFPLQQWSLYLQSFRYVLQVNPGCCLPGTMTLFHGYPGNHRITELQEW